MQLAELARLLQLGPQRVDFRLEPPPSRQALEHDLELRRPQRLEQVVGDPGAQRLDRAVERGLARDHDAVALGIRLARRAEHLDAVAVGQVDVDDEDFRLELLDRAARLARGADGRGSVRRGR